MKKLMLVGFFVLLCFSLFANYIPPNYWLYQLWDMEETQKGGDIVYPRDMENNNTLPYDFYFAFYDSSSTVNYYDLNFYFGGDYKLSNIWHIFSSVYIFHNAEKKPNYVAYLWKFNSSAIFPECGIEGKGDWWKIMIGRRSDKIGFSPLSGLLLSGWMQMDGLFVDFTKNNLRFYARYFMVYPYVVENDSIETFTHEYIYRGTIVYRYLSFHGLEYKFNKITIGVVEGALFGDYNRPFVYFNPMSFYYGDQSNWAEVFNDNIFWDFYGKMNFDKGYWYWEIMVDDIQYERKDSGDYEPQQFGVLFGYVGWIKNWYSNFEVSFITPWVYNQKFPWNKYEINGVSIGSQYGPDHLSIYYEGMYDKGMLSPYVETMLLWKGENTIEDDWIFPVMDDSIISDIFLYGTPSFNYFIRGGIVFNKKHYLIKIGAGYDGDHGIIAKGEILIKGGFNIE